ncbi:MAG: hypothetical protein HY921_07045 [Elusimicrobia bacterium]|nr:hypothetical protein [Elusimicrobiota bacterium]
MRRLILGLTAGCFLFLAAVQSWHWHGAVEALSCHTCLLSSQAVRHLPTPAPKVAPAASRSEAFGISAVKVAPIRETETSARSPPSA